MKKLSLFLVLVVVLSVFSMSTFAATNPIDFEATSIDYSSGDLTVAIKANEDFFVDIAYFTIMPTDKTKWTITDTAAGIVDKGSIGIVNNEVRVANDGMTDFKAGDVLMPFTAIPADGADVNGSTFVLTAIDLTNSDTDESPWFTDGTVGSTLTINVKSADPEKPVITTVAEEKGATIETEDTIYTNIFKGEYSATPVEGVGISEIGIKYHNTDVTAGDAVTLKKNVTIVGGATVNFKAAILGVAADTELVVEPYTVYDFAK